MIHVFYSRIPDSTGTHLRGQVPPQHPLCAIIEAAIRNPENYRHVATCTAGGVQDVLESLQEGEALPRRLGLRGLILGDLMVDAHTVWIVTHEGLRELTDVTLEAYKYRNVSTFSVFSR